jgi:hypothetical protein
VSDINTARQFWIRAPGHGEIVRAELGPRQADEGTTSVARQTVFGERAISIMSVCDARARRTKADAWLQPSLDRARWPPAERPTTQRRGGGTFRHAETRTHVATPRTLRNAGATSIDRPPELVAGSTPSSLCSRA